MRREKRYSFEYLDALPVSGDTERLALNHALDELSRIDERQESIAEMKFFRQVVGSRNIPAGISRTTVDRDWATARVWLHRQMSRTARP